MPQFIIEYINDTNKVIHESHVFLDIEGIDPTYIWKHAILKAHVDLVKSKVDLSGTTQIILNKMTKYSSFHINSDYTDSAILELYKTKRVDE